MAYRSMKECVDDLDRHGMLLRIQDEVDPYLEMAEIQREVFKKEGPAILFERVKGTRFPAVSNLFGTLDRAKFIFKDTLPRTRRAIEIKAYPERALQRFWRYLDAPITGLTSLPMRAWHAPVLSHETTISELPLIQSWPDDGGAFITLPQVYSEDPLKSGPLGANIGMYRVQLTGGQYILDNEIGLHYQIHRGIGVHHAEANRQKRPLKVSIFVGGPPAHTVAAVMPLPEGLSETLFAGMLAGRRFRHANWNGWRVAADADFCILGTIEGTRTKPEGPFGDHLGYYSLVHDFPVMKVEKVFHRPSAIWPFTVVGRPPQEDSTFGALIHELTSPMVPVSIPGVKAMHAVDSAGVHPLLFVVGSERYTPFSGDDAPKELLTQACAVLGFNQASLAKYLWIADQSELHSSSLVNDEVAFLKHCLERLDMRRDLHFITETTMDTLDYSGSGLNRGSKLILAACGKVKRQLGERFDLADGEAKNISWLPEGFTDPRMVMPGVLVVRGPKFENYAKAEAEFSPWSEGRCKVPDEWPLLVVVDDVDFCARDIHNWLWVTFTRSQPSHDVYGGQSFTRFKHWGAEGALIIDARLKPHHAPPLVEDQSVSAKVFERLSKVRGL